RREPLAEAFAWILVWPRGTPKNGEQQKTRRFTGRTRGTNARGGDGQRLGSAGSVRQSICLRTCGRTRAPAEAETPYSTNRGERRRGRPRRRGDPCGRARAGESAISLGSRWEGRRSQLLLHSVSRALGGRG